MNQEMSKCDFPNGIVKLDKEAGELADLATRIDLVAKVIENLQYQHQSGDDFAVTHFLRHGQLALMYENLNLVKDEIRSLSNKIYQSEGGK